MFNASDASENSSKNEEDIYSMIKSVDIYQRIDSDRHLGYSVYSPSAPVVHQYFSTNPDESQIPTGFLFRKYFLIKYKDGSKVHNVRNSVSDSIDSSGEIHEVTTSAACLAANALFNFRKSKNSKEKPVLAASLRLGQCSPRV